MAVDMFLKIDGIDGESPDAKHKNEIEILSYSFGSSQSGTSSFGGGMGAGKVSMEDFHFVMRHNAASPKLMQANAGGDHIKSAILTVRKAGKEQQEFKKVTFTDILVSSYHTSGNGQGNEIPMDQISLNFSKIEMEYKTQTAQGTLQGTVKGSWDLKKNTK